MKQIKYIVSGRFKETPLERHSEEFTVLGEDTTPHIKGDAIARKHGWSVWSFQKVAS